MENNVPLPTISDMLMKRSSPIVIILLNALFCVALLWFFTRNAFLRPYMGNSGKEIVAGLLLLASIYANYFILYPKMYAKRRLVAYWGIVISISFLSALAEMILSYSGRPYCNSFTIADPQDFLYMTTQTSFVIGRNLAFNIFTFAIGNSRHFRESYDKEVSVVYKQNRMLDAIDNVNDCKLIDVNDIYYCQQDRNIMHIHTVQHEEFKRYCSMKHLEQIFEEKDFVRISGNVMVPYRFILSVYKNEVLLKPLSMQENAPSFIINPKKTTEITEKITKYFQQQSGTVNNESPIPTGGSKLNAVSPNNETIALAYIQTHLGCKTQAIATALSCSSSTAERILAQLKKDGLIEYVGSKKTGGYRAIDKPKPDNDPNLQSV